MEKIQDGTRVEDVNQEALHDATDSEKAAVIRKIDYRLLPILFVLYSFSVLDRSNLGNVRLAGLEDDIDLSNWRYNWLGTCFYIACKYGNSSFHQLCPNLLVQFCHMGV